jgi:hypothetical protein
VLLLAGPAFLLGEGPEPVEARVRRRGDLVGVKPGLGLARRSSAALLP